MTKTSAFTLSVTLALNVATSTITPASDTGNTYYVATNGSDSNSGNFDRPFRTIKQGLSALKGGDTLLIRAGRYDEAIEINPSVTPSISGTSDNNRTWIGAYQGENVTLLGTAKLQAVLHLSGNVHYITIDTIHFNAGGEGLRRYGAIINPDSANEDGPGAQHIRIQNSEFFNADSCAVGVFMSSRLKKPGTGASYNEFINVSSHDNGRVVCKNTLPAGLSAHGWYIASDYNLFDRIQAYNNGQTGMQIYSSSGNPTGNIVRNSYFASNGIAKDVGNGGLDVFGSDHQIYNNIFVNGGSSLGRNGGNNNLFYNNTIYNNPDIGLLIGPGGSGHVAKNNIIYGNGQEIINEGASVTFSNNLCGTPGTGCDMVGNPLFIDAANGNYDLQSISPAIGASTSYITPNITSSSPDIGAH